MVLFNILEYMKVGILNDGDFNLGVEYPMSKFDS